MRSIYPSVCVCVCVCIPVHCLEERLGQKVRGKRRKEILAALNVDFPCGESRESTQNSSYTLDLHVKGSLDKTIAPVVLLPGLQQIFLKAMTSVKKQATCFLGIVFRGTTEEFYLASVFSLEQSVSQLSLSSWH